jgi:UV DNA damage repair endonuclease
MNHASTSNPSALAWALGTRVRFGLCCQFVELSIKFRTTTAKACQALSRGVFPDKKQSLDRFARNLDRLSEGVRSRLTAENDDKVYAPSDLLRLRRAEGVSLVPRLRDELSAIGPRIMNSPERPAANRAS